MKRALFILQGKVRKYQAFILYLLFQTGRPDSFVNSVDQDERAHNEPSPQDLHCLPFCFGFFADTPVFSSPVPKATGALIGKAMVLCR